MKTEPTQNVLSRITHKDVVFHTGVSINTAYRILKEIKKEYKTSRPTLGNLIDFLGYDLKENSFVIKRDLVE